MGKDFKSKKKHHKSGDKYHGIKRVSKKPEPLEQFNFGLRYEEYHNILYNINEFAQADFAGEVGGEIKTRVESKLHLNRFLNGVMMFDAVGDRNAHVGMTPARWDRVQDEASKRHSIKREEYYREVKEFIGKILKYYVHKDMILALQIEREYNEIVNGETSAVRFMDWLEAIVKSKLRWSVESQLGSIENLIRGDYNIAKAKSPMSYVTMMKQLIKEYKSLKLSRLIQEQEAYDGRRMEPEMIILKEVQVSAEVNRSNFLLVHIYREIKDFGITKNIRSMWANRERERCLKSNESPFETIDSLLTESIKHFDYMLSEGVNPEPENVYLRINNAVMDPDKTVLKKCFKCVSERGEDKVNHRWYDCVRYNPKCKNYKGDKKNDKKKGVDKDGIAKAIKEYKDPTKLAAAIHALINKEDETSNSDSNESNSSSD